MRHLSDKELDALVCVREQTLRRLECNAGQFTTPYGAAEVAVARHHWLEARDEQRRRQDGSEGMSEYIVLCGQVVGSEPYGFETVYDFDGKRYPTREGAIRHGLRIRGSDDFNIGVVEGGKLVSLDWMDEVGDTEPDVLEPIAEQIGL